LDLRFDLKKVDKKITAKLGSPKKGEDRPSEAKAIEILQRIRSLFHYEYISAYRDVASERFNASLQNVFEKKLREAFTHNKQAGAPAGYRALTRAADTIFQESVKQLNPVLNTIVKSVSSALVHSAAANIKANKEDLVEWIASKAALKLETGEHDEEKVDAVEVGSGLQSSLDLALRRTLIDSSKKVILAIDEPEAFLHPSAQRRFGRQLLSKDGFEWEKLIITTHSPIIVEEAEYIDIIVADNQKYYSSSKEETGRYEINTAFLRGQGAEMLFGNSILLVEGEGDRLFFEIIRRRLAADSKEAQLDRAFVVGVGSNTQFAPWIRLLKSFKGASGNTFFNFICAVDGDSATQISESFRKASIDIDADVRRAFQTVQGHFSSQHRDEWHKTIGALNQLCKERHVPSRLMVGDLEYAAINKVTSNTLSELYNALNYTGKKDAHSLMYWLGSKGMTGNAPSDGNKEPWRRAKMGQVIPLKQLDDSIKSVIRAWFKPFSVGRAILNELADV